MGAQPLQFDSEAANRLQRIYLTPYAQHRRAAVREALALQAVDTSDTMLQLSRQRCADLPCVEFQTDQEGRYFFCLNQYLYLAVKPTEGLM